MSGGIFIAVVTYNHYIDHIISPFTYFSLSLEIQNVSSGLWVNCNESNLIPFARFKARAPRNILLTAQPIDHSRLLVYSAHLHFHQRAYLSRGSHGGDTHNPKPRPPSNPRSSLYPAMESAGIIAPCTPQ
jgi:hypothetical protein